MIVLLGMRLIRAIVAAMAVAAVMLPSAPASAQSSEAIFLKLAGIEGESQNDRHKGGIELLSWSWGASFTAPGGGGGGGAGKATVQDLSLTKHTDTATPKILEAAIKGKVLRSAVLSVDTGGEVPQTYLKITMTDVLVTNIQTSQSSGDRPMDSVSLNFSRIVWEHRRQNADGSLGELVRTCWDVRANRAC